MKTKKNKNLTKIVLERNTEVIDTNRSSERGEERKRRPPKRILPNQLIRKTQIESFNLILTPTKSIIIDSLLSLEENTFQFTARSGSMLKRKKKGGAIFLLLKNQTNSIKIDIFNTRIGYCHLA